MAHIGDRRQWCRAGSRALTDGMPTTDPQMRAADADRSAVAEVLGAAVRDGRLTVPEYDERLAAAYAARTHADLAVLTSDLAVLTSDLPAAARPAGAPAYGSCGGPGGADLRAAWRGWAFVAVLVVGIWAVTSLGSGDLTYPWPVWVVGPWGAVLLARTLTTRGSLARHG